MENNSITIKSLNDEQDKQTSGTTGKKIILGIFAIPMVLLNVSLNAIQSVGRRALELLVGILVFVASAIKGLFLPIELIQPEGWIGIGLCCLAGLFSAIFFGVICAVCVLYWTAVETLKTPFLLLVSACSWIYKGFVGYVRLFKNVGKNEIFVSNRYQRLDSEPEKAQKVSSTKATLGYTFGFYDVKSKDEVEEEESQKLLDEDEKQKTEYVVKPKSFPYRTGGYMIY